MRSALGFVAILGFATACGDASTSKIGPKGGSANDDDSDGAETSELSLPNTEDKEKTRVAGAQRVPWWPGRAAYDEIKRLVRLEHLVPLEAVWLTEHSGFWDAVDGGKENLKTKKEFHSMLDIVRARESGVTPLPVSNGR